MSSTRNTGFVEEIVAPKYIMADECPICGDKLGNEYIKTPCNHKFCETCFKNIQRVKDPNDHDKTILPCPMCRAPIGVAIRKQNNKETKQATSTKPQLPKEIITEIIKENKENFGNTINCDDIIREIKAANYNNNYEIDETIIMTECEKQKGGKKRRTKKMRTKKRKTIKKRKRFNKITK